MKGAEQALVVETLPVGNAIIPLNSANPDETPQNPKSDEDAMASPAPLSLHPAGAPGTQQQHSNPPQPSINPPNPSEATKQDLPNTANPVINEAGTIKIDVDHHRQRSRSRSQDRRRSRSPSRGRRDRSRSPEHHHREHQHQHYRSHRDEVEKEEGRRGRSPGKHSHDHDNHSHHVHHQHHSSHEDKGHHEHHHHRRRSRSRSRDDGNGHHHHHHEHSRKRSRSHSPEHHQHHHRHRQQHSPTVKERNNVAVNITGTVVEAVNDIDESPPVDPSEKTMVRHESTLVALRPSASPRSFPLSALELAAEALKTPPFAGSPYNEPLSLGPLIFGASQAKGMRPYMEDRHIIQEPLVPRGSSGAPVPDNTPRSFAAVYDGHNGTLAADHAADRLHFILAAEPAFRTCTGDGPPAAIHREGERITSALVHAFEATDKEILARCRAESARGGATGVVLLRIGEMLYAAHCGDSRAVLCRSGEALRLTEDHKPNLPRERKRVEDLGGRVDFARCWRVIVDPGGGRPASGLAVSRSFGDPDFKQPLHLVTATPDVMSERLTEEDSFVILASDGLWDVMTDKRACEIVKTRIATTMANASGGGEKVSASLIATLAAQALVQSALNAGTMDNVTAVVGLLKWS